MLNIVIPIQEESWKLEGCIASIEKHTKDCRITIHKNPSINVAEARQQAMDENKDKYICFLDDDTRIIQDDWVERLLAAQADPNICISFASEIWEGEGPILGFKKQEITCQGPAACMMIDTSKIPNDHKWDEYIGLSSGWLGGDYEEADYVSRLAAHGLYAIGLPGVFFLHTDRIPSGEFAKTDRAKTSYIMQSLIQIKGHFGNESDFFKSLNYVRADPNNDRMLAGGETLRKCFYGVLKDNNLLHFPMFKRWGLT